MSPVIEQFLAKQGVTSFTTSHVGCPHCEIMFIDGVCLKCKKRVEDFAVEPYFSNKSCDCCGTNVSGNRYDAIAFAEEDGSVLKFVVCEDCDMANLG